MSNKPNKLTQLFERLNDKGFPLPLIRDNRAKKGSHTLTMFWISFNVALILLIGKVTQVIGEVDYSNVLWLFGMTGAFYLGRKFQVGPTGVSISARKKK